MFRDPESQSRTELAARVQRVLASRNLNLSQVSQKSATLFGRSSPYFLPHNFYYDLRLGTFSPSIYQMFALSSMSGYRLADWLRVFQFDLDDIPYLQVLLPSKRTILLSSSLLDGDAYVPWVRNRDGNNPAPPTAPLTQLLEFAGQRRLEAIPAASQPGTVYAKIGCQDAFAFPDLLPGSIVRVSIAENLPELPGVTSPIFLLERGGVFWCSRVRVVGGKHVMTLATQAPEAPIELPLPDEARIVGVVDLEIRPLVTSVPPRMSHEFTRLWNMSPFSTDKKLSHLLRNARLSLDMTFREASALSRQIADLLGNQQYFISSSSLSDYEACDTAPRHFHKLVSLCVIYALNLFTVMKAADIDVEQAGTEPIPNHLIAAPLPTGTHRSSIGILGDKNEAEKTDNHGFLGELLRRCGVIPFFLRNSWAALSGLRTGSLQDLFWIGGESNPLHPYLRDGLVAVVNRRRKKPLFSPLKPAWQQPLFLILQRDGKYLSCCCGLENRTLVIHSYRRDFGPPDRLNGRDAEIVGQIVTIARRLR